MSSILLWGEKKQTNKKAIAEYGLGKKNPQKNKT